MRLPSRACGNNSSAIPMVLPALKHGISSNITAPTGYQSVVDADLYCVLRFSFTTSSFT